MDQYTIDALWCKMPLEVAFDDRLTRTDLKVYCVIAAGCIGRGWFWKKQNELAEDAGIHRVSFTTSINKLREYGYIRTWEHKKTRQLGYAVAAHTRQIAPETLSEDAEPPLGMVKKQSSPPPMPPPVGVNPARDALVNEANALFGKPRTPTEAQKRTPIIDELLAANISADDLRRATQNARLLWSVKATLRSVAMRIGELSAAIPEAISPPSPNADEIREKAKEERQARQRRRMEQGIYTPEHQAYCNCGVCLRNKLKYEKTVAKMHHVSPDQVLTT